MPPTLQPPQLRQLNTLVGNTRNNLSKLTGRQGLESGPAGEKGEKGEPGKIEPKDPGASIERTAGEPHEVSGTKAANVYLTIKPKAGKVGYEILVGGKPVFHFPPELAGFPRGLTLTLGAAELWEVVMLEGEAEIFSVYQEYE